MSREQTLREIRARRVVLAALGHRRARPPAQLQPDAIRLEYAKALQPMLDLMRSVTRRRLAAWIARHGRSDAAGDDPLLQDILDAIADELFQATPNEQLRRTAEKFARRTSDFQREQLAAQFRAAVGVDLTRTAEPWLADAVRAFTQENVSLIKSVPSEYLDDLRDRLLEGVQAGESASTLADMVEERYGVAESRAKLIANDQIGKFYGDLNEERQTHLGVTGYLWRGVLDERERPEHVAREGESFQWDDPPEDGHPGEPVNCRCYAEPDLTDLLADE